MKIKRFVGRLFVLVMVSWSVFAKDKYETDVVVVGGGGAGIVAALSAAEKGANVVLIEKMGYLGGATLMSGGIIPAVGTKQQKDAKIEDSLEAFEMDILRPANYSQNRNLVEVVVSDSKPLIEWLESKGIKFNLITNALYHGQSNYRMHLAEGSGIGMTEKLIEALKNDPKITVLLNTEGTGLITDKKGILGVTAKDRNGNDIEIKGQNVVLATSGFASNSEMMKKYIPEMVDAYPLTAPGATGEGIVWGEKLGAEVKNMHAYQGHGTFSTKLRSSVDLYILYRGGILVNNEGKRFTNEYMGYSELAPHVVNQKDNIAYIIFDKANADATRNMPLYLEKGIVIEAGTIKELAARLGVNEKNLEASVNQYMEGMKNGEDVFNRTKFPKEFKGPFYAIEITGDLRHTQGGLVTSTEGAVLKDDGTPIKGLYAAGGVTEGFSGAGGPNYMSGNGLLQAFIFGKRAGYEAAKIEKPLKETKIELGKKKLLKSDVKPMAFKDGLYVGTGEGYRGPIRVEVVIASDKIKDIKVVSSSDTKLIFNSAVEGIKSQLLTNQNIEKVDSVAGATSSSKGIITAVKNALKNGIKN